MKTINFTIYIKTKFNLAIIARLVTKKGIILKINSHTIHIIDLYPHTELYLPKLFGLVCFINGFSWDFHFL